MPSVTTAELVERAKAAADMHDAFVTLKQWMYWASQERMALDLFLARSGWTQDFEAYSYTVTGSEAGSFVIPVDLMAIVAVHEVTSNYQVRRLKLRDPATFLHNLPGSSITQGHSIEYRVKRVGDRVTLSLYPEPLAGEQYLITYVPHSLRLTLDAVPAAGYANTVAYPMGWEERIVLGMARRAMDKEESDSTAIQRQMVEMNSNIEALCWDRVSGDGPSVINRDMDTYGWTDRISYPQPINWWWA